MRVSRTAMLAAVVVGSLSCDSLTSVDADIVEPRDYATAAGASTLGVGAITGFARSYGGGHVWYSGLFTDELTGLNSSNADQVAWDGRNTADPASTNVPYGSLQEGRQRLLSAIESFQAAAPDSGARIGQLFALSGYNTTFLGEVYCAGVPLSHRDAQLRPVYGQPLTTAQLMDSAIAAFDAALLRGVDSARIVNLARVGRGRALLNAGRYAEAAVAVASVPTNYVYSVDYLGAGSGLSNQFFPASGAVTFARDVTIPQREGTNGMNWRSASDPRVQLINRGAVSAGSQDTIYGFVPYQAANAPIRLASGIEARLIEAEASLQAGNTAAWLATLNTLRALGTAGGGVNGLGALADPGTAAGRVDTQFRERAFWLFLTGHRLGDLRRLVRQYGRNAESVFPTGVSQGRVYGTAANMAVPGGELANPNFSGCLNRDA